MPDLDDWRRQGQERYLKGLSFAWKKYAKYNDAWDHDHCEFCGAKFMESKAADVLTVGYATEDNSRWICKQCFDDFQSEYGWRVNNAV